MLIYLREQSNNSRLYRNLKSVKKAKSKMRHDDNFKILFCFLSIEQNSVQKQNVDGTYRRFNSQAIHLLFFTKNNIES